MANVIKANQAYILFFFDSIEGITLWRASSFVAAAVKTDVIEIKKVHLTKKRETTRKLSLDCQTKQSKDCYFLPFFLFWRIHLCSLILTSFEFKCN